MKIRTLIKPIIESTVFRLLFISIILHTITYAIIGLSSKGSFYSETVSKYLNYPYYLRKGLLVLAHRILVGLNYDATVVNHEYIYNMQHGGGIHVAYACLGFGVTSLWIGFVISFRSIAISRKILLINIGFLVINSVNVLRMVLLFISPNKALFGIDHHDLYNILVHIIVLLMAVAVVNRTKRMSATAEMAPA